jgi:hypothetical protein
VKPGAAPSGAYYFEDAFEELEASKGFEKVVGSAEDWARSKRVSSLAYMTCKRDLPNPFPSAPEFSDHDALLSIGYQVSVSGFKSEWNTLQADGKTTKNIAHNCALLTKRI